MAPAYAQPVPTDLPPSDSTTEPPAGGQQGGTGGLTIPGGSSTGTTGSSSATSSSSTGTTPASTTPPPTAVELLPSTSTTIVGSPFGAGTGAPAEISTARTSSELGIAVGEFMLFPQIEINGGYDDNVFAQAPSQGPVGSFYTTVAPSLDLRSDWLNHELHFTLGGTFGFYEQQPSQNYQNFNLGVGGKVDIQTDFYVTWSLGYMQSNEPLGSPNAPSGSGPNIVDAIPVSLSLYQKFNRFYYKVSLNATRTYYYDGTPVTSSATLPGTSRDLTVYDESVQFGYELTDDLSIYISPDINQRRYLNTVNAAGQSRDSDGQSLSVGAAWTLSPTSSLNGTVGYTTQTYSSGLGTDNALTYTLGGNWNGYEPLNLRPSISRTIQETPLSNYSNYVSTVYGLDYDWIIHDAWTLTGGLSLTTADYNPISGSGANARTDYFFRSRIGLLYSLRPQIQIGPMIEYSSAWSTDQTNGPYFDREIFSLRLIARR